jgi:hypothetical protein
MRLRSRHDAAVVRAAIDADAAAAGQWNSDGVLRDNYV